MNRKAKVIIGCIGAIILGSYIGVSAYFDVPQETNIMSMKQGRQRAGCPHWVQIAGEQAQPLPSSFRLASWNIYKTQNKGWQQQLDELARNANIIALQEAKEESTQNYWRQLGWSATMLEAFAMGKSRVGVQLASKYPPQQVCGLRQKEPLIRLPKSLLLGVYPLEHSNYSLWVVNVHSINFTLQVKPYVAQLEAIAQLLHEHHGPLIITGDFNTWSQWRQKVLHQWMNQHRLHEVVFTQDKRTRFFGHALDHIFYRGLTLDKTEVVPTNASDHNALLAQFGVIRSAE